MPLKNINPAAIVAAVMAMPATAADSWESIPDDPSMAPYCVPDREWSIKIASFKAKGATPMQMLHWAEAEAEKTGGADPWIAFGSLSALIEFIEDDMMSVDDYTQIPGGFPAFAYRSCLKGKPLYRRN